MSLRMLSLRLSRLIESVAVPTRVPIRSGSGLVAALAKSAAAGMLSSALVLRTPECNSGSAHLLLLRKSRSNP